MIGPVTSRTFWKPPPLQRREPKSEPDQVILKGEIGPSQPLQSQLLREPKKAREFVDRFTEELRLAPASIQEREDMMRRKPSSFYRMFPLLFHRDLRGPYKERAQLLDRPAPILTI